METQRQARADAEASALAQLRAFVPRRSLRYSEALRIAENQAEWLLRLAQAKEPPVPTDFISRLPRVEVILDHSSPIAGSAHWDGHDWIIVINARKRAPTRRFSLAHELKHVIDHTTRGFLYTGMPRMTATEQAERAADYFTGCLLMPNSWLKQASKDGCRTAGEFAHRFDVPLHAAEKRLTQIGLAPEQTRQLQLIDDTAVDPQIQLPIGAEA